MGKETLIQYGGENPVYLQYDVSKLAMAEEQAALAQMSEMVDFSNSGNLAGQMNERLKVLVARREKQIHFSKDEDLIGCFEQEGGGKSDNRQFRVFPPEDPRFPDVGFVVSVRLPEHFSVNDAASSMMIVERSGKPRANLGITTSGALWLIEKHTEESQRLKRIWGRKDAVENPDEINKRTNSLIKEFQDIVESRPLLNFNARREDIFSGVLMELGNTASRQGEKHFFLDASNRCVNRRGDFCQQFVADVKEGLHKEPDKEEQCADYIQKIDDAVRGLDFESLSKNLKAFDSFLREDRDDGIHHHLDMRALARSWRDAAGGETLEAPPYMGILIASSGGEDGKALLDKGEDSLPGSRFEVMPLREIAEENALDNMPYSNFRFRSDNGGAYCVWVPHRVSGIVNEACEVISHFSDPKEKERAFEDIYSLIQVWPDLTPNEIQIQGEAWKDENGEETFLSRYADALLREKTRENILAEASEPSKQKFGFPVAIENGNLVSIIINTNSEEVDGYKTGHLARFSGGAEHIHKDLIDSVEYSKIARDAHLCEQALGFLSSMNAVADRLEDNGIDAGDILQYGVKHYMENYMDDDVKRVLGSDDFKTLRSYKLEPGTALARLGNDNKVALFDGLCDETPVQVSLVFPVDDFSSRTHRYVELAVTIGEEESKLRIDPMNAHILAKDFQTELDFEDFQGVVRKLGRAIAPVDDVVVQISGSSKGGERLDETIGSFYQTYPRSRFLSNLLEGPGSPLFYSAQEEEPPEIVKTIREMLHEEINNEHVARSVLRLQAYNDGPIPRLIEMSKDSKLKGEQKENQSVPKQRKPEEKRKSTGCGIG